MNRAIIGLLLAFGLAQTALAGSLPTQPANERARQKLFPASDDPIWTTLQKSRITADEKRGIYTAEHPMDVILLQNQDLLVRGFLLPLDVMPPFTHFILSRYTPVCAFCPPGAPNEAIELFTSRPVKINNGAEVMVKGRFAMTSDSASGLFFRITNGEVL